MNIIFNGLLLLVGSLGLVIVPTPASPTGWRTDGTGRYPDASPPTTWGPQNNIRWKTRMPGASQGSPIVVGQHLFVVSDPAELLCVDKTSGVVAWQRSCGLAEVFGEVKAGEITTEYKRLRDEKGKAEKDLAAAKGDADREAELKKQVDEYNKQLQALAMPPEFAPGEATNSAPTPVSDGKNVFAVFGNGVIAAYTVNGEKLWVRHLEVPTIGWGHCSSPLLADGKLVVHLNTLYALDANSGEVVWKVPASVRHASPILTRFQDKRVVISPVGSVLRLSDGHELLKSDLLSVSQTATPVLHDDVLYKTGEGQSVAVRLASGNEDTLTLEKKWEERISSGGRTPSPVLHENRLYSVNTDGILDVLDAKTGKSLHKQRLNLGRVYSSVAAAGDYIFISGTKGMTLVLDPEKKFREVARNQLDGFGSNLVFEDDNLFIRTRENLYCIGE